MNCYYILVPRVVTLVYIQAIFPGPGEDLNRVFTCINVLGFLVV